MKIVIRSLAVILFVMGITGSVQASNTVQVILQSPLIYQEGCEQIGYPTFRFEARTVLKEGDWLYMDLPLGTSICNGLDYMVVSNAGVGVAADNVTTLDYANVALGGDVKSVDHVVATGYPDGPLSMIDVGGVGDDVGLTTIGGMVFRVRAVKNSQRVYFLCYGTTSGYDSITVPGGTAFQIPIVDGKPHQNNILLNTDTTVNTPSIWGDEATDTINDERSYNNSEDSLSVNAESVPGSLMFVSFGSLNDFMNFTGDSQIAHFGINPITANAGPDQIVFKEVTLDGSDSLTTNSLTLSYEWQLLHRENSNYDYIVEGEIVIVTGLEPGFYDVTLRASNEWWQEDTDEMTIAATGIKGDLDNDGDVDGDDIINFSSAYGSPP